MVVRRNDPTKRHTIIIFRVNKHQVIIIYLVGKVFLLSYTSTSVVGKASAEILCQADPHPVLGSDNGTTQQLSTLPLAPNQHITHT